MLPSVKHQLDQFVPRTELGTQVREIVGKHYPGRTCAQIEAITDNTGQLYGFEIMLTTTVKLKFLFWFEQTNKEKFERFLRLQRVTFPQTYEYPKLSILFEGLFPLQGDSLTKLDLHLLERLITHHELFAVSL